jgi:uncharacterized RDD family membrane protein YckC
MTRSEGQSFPVARTWKRVAAFLVDGFIIQMIWWPLSIRWSEGAITSGVVEIQFSVIASLVLLTLFYKWLFLYFLGGTIGKLMMGIRVVPFNAPLQSLGLLQSLLRVLVDGFSIFFGGALKASAWFRFDRRHVGDWVAETQVIQFSGSHFIPDRRWMLAILIMIQMSIAQWSLAYHQVSRLSLEWDQKVLQIRGLE